MTDVVAQARSARECLAKGLGALQSPGVPEHLMSVAEPIARAMSNLHRIEASGGQELGAAAPVALEAVRSALSLLQSAPITHPAVDAAMESVAGSLGLVHGLSQTMSAPAPAPVAHVPAAPVAMAATAVIQPSAFPAMAPSYGAPATTPSYGAPAATPAGWGIPAPAPVSAPPGWGVAVTSPAPAPAPMFAPMDLFARAEPGSAMGGPAPSPAQFAATCKSDAPPPPPAGEPGGIPNSTLPSSGNIISPLASAAAVPFGAGPTQPEAAALRRDAGLPLVDASLGAHSPTNFYKGLSGNDVFDAGGLFVETYKILAIGTPILLHVSLPGGYEFQAEAVVRWTREPTRSSDGAPPGFGAQITQISAEGRQLVHRYVRNREPLFHDDL